MPIQVLGRRVVHNVRPELKGALEIRRGESVVDDEQCPGFSCDGSGCSQIGDSHQRVCRRLDENRARVGPHCIRDALRVARIHVGEGEPKVLKYSIEKSERPAVDVLGANDVIARTEQLHDRIEAAHTAGECEAVATALESGNVPLESLPRRVLPPGVFIAFMLAQRVLHVRRREIYGRHDRSGQRLRALASVNSARAEAGGEVLVEDASHGEARLLSVVLKILPEPATDEA